MVSKGSLSFVPIGKQFLRVELHFADIYNMKQSLNSEPFQ